MIAQDAMKPCDVISVADARTLAPAVTTSELSVIVASQPSCRYLDAGGGASVIVKFVWIDPTQVARWRAQIAKPLAGTVTPIDNDPDAAHFQQQEDDMMSYALIYVRKNIQVEVRVMSTASRKLGATRAKQLLLGLPRGP